MSRESIEAIRTYLDEQGADYELVEHEARFTAAAEARASGVEPGDAAKDLILRDVETYVLAAIPASERLDLGKARELLEAGKSLRLATEKEIWPGLRALRGGRDSTLRAPARDPSNRRPASARARPCALQRRGSRARRTSRPQRDGPGYRSPRRRPLRGVIVVTTKRSERARWCGSWPLDVGGR